MGALLTDRAEQQAGEAAVPTRADDKQVGLPRRVDEHCRRASLDDATLDHDAVGIGHDLVQCGFEGKLGSATKLAEISPDHGGVALDPQTADVAVLPE